MALHQHDDVVDQEWNRYYQEACEPYLAAEECTYHEALALKFAQDICLWQLSKGRCDDL